MLAPILIAVALGGVYDLIDGLPSDEQIARDVYLGSYMLCDRPRPQRSARVRALQTAAVEERLADDDLVEVRYWVATGTRRIGLFGRRSTGRWETQTMSRADARAFNAKTCAEKRLEWMRRSSK